MNIWSNNNNSSLGCQIVSAIVLLTFWRARDTKLIKLCIYQILIKCKLKKRLVTMFFIFFTNYDGGKNYDTISDYLNNTYSSI